MIVLRFKISVHTGDHIYKKNSAFPNTKQIITALPNIKVIDTKQENGDLIILACDGIWNSMNSQSVVDFVSNRIHATPNIRLSSICEEVGTITRSLKCMMYKYTK